MKKNFSNTKTMRLVLSVCFALGGFCAQDSNLYAHKGIKQDAISLYDKWDGIEDGIVCNIFAARNN